MAKNITFTEIVVMEEPVSKGTDVLSTVKIIPVYVSKEFFEKTLKTIAQKHCPYKYFNKSFRSYYIQNLVLESKMSKEGQSFDVYTKDMIAYLHDSVNNILHVAYNKKNNLTTRSLLH